MQVELSVENLDIPVGLMWSQKLDGILEMIYLSETFEHILCWASNINGIKIYICKYRNIWNNGTLLNIHEILALERKDVRQKILKEYLKTTQVKMNEIIV
jgi:hypothetical protein